MCHLPVKFKTVEKVTCTICRGSGHTRKRHKKGPGKTCPTCRGSGRMPSPKIFVN